LLISLLNISSQEEFGLRFLLHLAKADQGKEVSLAAIARLEGVSLAYVRKIFGILRQNSLVCASKGAQGGFSLIRRPEQIFLEEVFRSLSPESKAFSCDRFSGHLHQCANLSSCTIKPLLLLLQERVNSILREVSLADLIQEKEHLAQQLMHKFYPSTQSNNPILT